MNRRRLILVLGGAGYVGSVLVRRLLNLGYKVRVVDTFYFGSESLDDVIDLLEVHYADIRQLSTDLFKGVDAVINVAGLSNDPTANYDPVGNFQMNAEATGNVATHCLKAGVDRYLFASSCSVYHTGEPYLPIDDNPPRCMLESDRVGSSSAYSASKLEGERRLLQISDPNFCPVILRKGTIYGQSPRMRFDLVVNTFVKNVLAGLPITLHNNGAAWRPMVNIKNVVDAYITCLEADSKLVKGQIFNVGAGNIQIRELCDRVVTTLRSLGLSPKLQTCVQASQTRSYRVSTDKMRDLLGFSGDLNIEVAVKEMVEALEGFSPADFQNNKYYNIARMKELSHASGYVRSDTGNAVLKMNKSVACVKDRKFTEESSLDHR